MTVMPEVLNRASILLIFWIPACAGMTAFKLDKVSGTMFVADNYYGII
jgi:hypothetical protein